MTEEEADEVCKGDIGLTTARVVIQAIYERVAEAQETINDPGMIIGRKKRLAEARENLENAKEVLPEKRREYPALSAYVPAGYTRLEWDQ